MTKRTKLLTSSAYNDVALGRLVGVLSALFLIVGAMELAERFWPLASDYNLLLSLWSPALTVAALVVCIFRWLRSRVPDFARGYRAGSVIVGIIFGAFFLLLTFHG
jgi:hypothetical protein